MNNTDNSLTHSNSAISLICMEQIHGNKKNKNWQQVWLQRMNIRINELMNKELSLKVTFDSQGISYCKFANRNQFGRRKKCDNSIGWFCSQRFSAARFIECKVKLLYFPLDNGCGRKLARIKSSYRVIATFSSSRYLAAWQLLIKINSNLHLVHNLRLKCFRGSQTRQITDEQTLMLN